MPPESVVFTYDGATTATATITGVTISNEYGFMCGDANSSPVYLNADADPFVMTVNDIGVANPGDTFFVEVQSDAPFYIVGATVFQDGSTDEYPVAATWTFDGDKTVTVTFDSTLDVNYQLWIFDSVGSGDSSIVAGTGASMMLTAVGVNTCTDDYFWAILQYSDTEVVFADRVFTAGLAGEGFFGNPLPAPTVLSGVNIAFENDALDENPTWVRIDDPDGYRLITGWSTRRGKDDNLDKSATGTASLKGIDLDGTLDPTNTGGPFYGQLGSQKPAIILIQHPFTLEWHSVFRGFVDRYNHDLDMWTDERGIDTFEIELYDGFGYLSRVELMPGVHGDPVSITDFPNIYYPGTPSNLADESDVFVHVDDRIVKLLDDAGWPNTGEKRNGLRDIFSGNVSVQGSVVDRGDGLMSALGDAVDAEFPGKANHYMSKDGVYSFRGRFAFVDPSNPGYGINTWDAGTATIARADSGVAAISGLRFSDQELINSCIALPQGVDDADVPGNLVEDSGSITAYGRSGATFPDLIVSAGHTDATPTTAVEECFKYADFYVGNQAEQRTIVTGLSFIGVTDDTLGPAIWDLMCGVEIGDVVNLTTTHPGGGGFDEELRVDNIAYTSEVGQPLRLELEVSPQPDYNPFGTVDEGVS